LEEEIFDNPGEAGLKSPMNTRTKSFKAGREENRILRMLLSNKEIELEVFQT